MTEKSQCLDSSFAAQGGQPAVCGVLFTSSDLYSWNGQTYISVCFDIRRDSLVGRWVGWGEVDANSHSQRQEKGVGRKLEK